MFPTLEGRDPFHRWFQCVSCCIGVGGEEGRPPPGGDHHRDAGGRAEWLLGGIDTGRKLWCRRCSGTRLNVERRASALSSSQGSRGPTVARGVGGRSTRRRTQRVCCWCSPVQDTPDTVLWNPPNGSTLHWRTLMESGARYAGGQVVAASSPTSTAPCSLRQDDKPLEKVKEHRIEFRGDFYTYYVETSGQRRDKPFPAKGVAAVGRGGVSCLCTGSSLRVSWHRMTNPR